MHDSCDVIIVGAGVIGCVVARELSAYRLRTAVLEKGTYLGSGQSKGNGAIVHGGHDPKPGTVKAILNVRGNQTFAGLCASLGVDFRCTGIYVVAFDDTELEVLKRLRARAEHNGVPGACIVGREEIRRTEPNLNPEAVGALSVPSGGVVDVLRLVIALAEHAAVNGVDFLFQAEVLDLIREDRAVAGVRTADRALRSRLVINCAGVYTDLIMRMAGLHSLRIEPRRGEYYILDRDYGLHVRRPCFPVPTPAGKGILIFPASDGSVIIGGDSQPVESRHDTSTTQQGLEIGRRNVLRLVPRLDLSRIIASFAGIRASGDSEDFVIEAPREVPGLINVAGIASPGLTAAPAIGTYVRDLVGQQLELRAKPGGRRPYRLQPLFRDLSDEDRQRALTRDPRYGNVVCRCEEITEGDIVGSLHAPIPARTLDALKFRTRAGLGRCQGAFDLSRILHIMSRELRVDPTSITKNDPGSEVGGVHLQRHRRCLTATRWRSSAPAPPAFRPPSAPGTPGRIGSCWSTGTTGSGAYSSSASIRVSELTPSAAT